MSQTGFDLRPPARPSLRLSKQKTKNELESENLQLRLYFVEK